MYGNPPKKSGKYRNTIKYSKYFSPSMESNKTFDDKYKDYTTGGAGSGGVNKKQVLMKCLKFNNYFDRNWIESTFWSVIQKTNALKIQAWVLMEMIWKILLLKGKIWNFSNDLFN